MQRLGHERFRYEKGLHALGDGLYAWLAPDGSWGWSNAGLVVDGEASLLVDTLFDLPLTREMLAAMRSAEPRAAASIDVLVNTHANGDHCYGNELVAGAEIVASRATAAEMSETPPEVLAAELTHLRIFAGYAGWAGGQLEEELKEGAWFVVAATSDGGFTDAFSADPDTLWRAVLRRQGGDLAMVSTYLADPSLN